MDVLPELVGPDLPRRVRGSGEGGHRSGQQGQEEGPPGACVHRDLHRLEVGLEGNLPSPVGVPYQGHLRPSDRSRKPMRALHAPLLPSLLAVVWVGATAATPAAGQQEVVDGFHGYPWGTHGASIAELSGTPRVGEKDGLAIHSTELTFLDREVLAGFYLHPSTGELVEGAYIFHVGLDECQDTWERALETLERAYPGLPRRVEKTSRPQADRDAYESDCEHYVFSHRSGDPEWRAELAGDDPSLGRVLVRLQPVGRSLRMTVLYQGAAAREWAERETPTTPLRPAS